MKKNWTVKVGVILVALTLITSCFVGSTFAKYTTAGEASDSARVAKFGVTVTGTGNLFAESYGGANGVTVKAETKVVAPGTAGALGGFTVTGTPEVDVAVTYTVDELTLTGWTDADGAYYCPLEITVGTTTLKGLDYASAAEFTAAIKEAIEYTTATYEAGNAVAADLSISWKWAFNGDDVKDTHLGDEAADGNAATVALKVTATVTQID